VRALLRAIGGDVQVDVRYVAAGRGAIKGVTMMEQIQTSADRLMDFVERVLIEKHR
jgi:hypothetical protein